MNSEDTVLCNFTHSEFSLDKRNEMKKTTEGSQNSEIKKSRNLRDFFSSDSSSGSSASICEEEDAEKKAQKKSDIVTSEGGDQKNVREEKDEKSNSDKSDEEERELRNLLRMATEINNTKHVNSSSSSELQKEQKKNKKQKLREGEISLLDCLETENCDENSDSIAEEKEKEKENGNFFSLFNNLVKKRFLLTSEESSQSCEEVEDEEQTKIKVKKKSKKKKEAETQKRKKDNLSEFRIPKFSSEESSMDEISKTEEIVEDSDDSVKCLQQMKKEKKKRKSDESELTIDSYSDSGSDIQQVFPKTESSPTKGRKNIKKILRKENLQIETKQALKMETDRKKRMIEREKLFEKLFPNADAYSKLILDFDPETKKEVVVVDDKLAQQLKPHQKEGVRFMWNNCFESVKRLEEDSGSGCILAHCMGLGKTLQVITLVHTVMTHDLGVNTVLIVCPLNTVSNWIREFRTWQKQCIKKIKPIGLVSCKSKSSRLAKVIAWSREGGVLVISYGMFRSFINDQKAVREFLDPGPDLVVCDEGHLLKNSKTGLSKSISGIKTLRRIILTGTPLQNNLMEYYCMVQFVKPNILGTVKEFKNRFFYPINNGQFEDSTELDVLLMKRRAHVLHKMLDGFIQRFGYCVLTPFLPEKQEYVISIALTETQENLYRFFIEQCNQDNRQLLKDFQWMQKAWTHPLVLQMHSSKRNPDDTSKDQWEKFIKANDYSEIRSSGKLYLLFSILRRCQEMEDKVLVFSQSLLSLDLIEFFLRKANEENSFGHQTEFANSWVFGEDYFRLDGSTSSENRDTFFQKFNDVNDKRFRLFLVSTKAGGLGVSLVAANRVVVFDASWNPTHDVQSIFRVYRFGQKKPCFIYRFLAAATMEEKIYKRQVTKLSLAHRILDEHQIERHYTMGNLQELYTYDPIPKSQRKVPKLPKDGLFADILSKNLDLIVGYHEHDSLLENKEEEELTEEEQKAAWEEYEKEKFILEHPYFPSNPLAPNGMSSGENSKVNFKLGFAPPNIFQRNSQSEKPLCKIVDVRTLNNEEMPPEKLLEIGRSFGMKPFPDETLERYRNRVFRTAGGFSNCHSESYY